MAKPILPTKIEYEVDKENKNKGKIIIEPASPGYGTTWGNTLRRVMLSSLEGAAVDAVKIKGVKYEYSTVPYVKEDVLDIILNLKLLRLKILSEKEEPVKLSLKASGEKGVYARDITKDARVEIVNPYLLIATLTNKKARLEMDIWAKKGYGWVPSEEKSREGIEIGTMVLDSTFSPVLNVAVNIENVRVGKRTDYDRLILTIETDGTISPKEAFVSSARLLADQFKFLKDSAEKIAELGVARKAKKAKKTKKTEKSAKKKPKRPRQAWPAKADKKKK